MKSLNDEQKPTNILGGGGNMFHCSAILVCNICTTIPCRKSLKSSILQIILMHSIPATMLLKNEKSNTKRKNETAAVGKSMLLLIV